MRSLIINQYIANAGSGTVSESDAYASCYAGYWEIPFSFNGSACSFILYTPEGSFPNGELILVLAPDGMSAKDFAAQADWEELAGQRNIALAFIQAPGRTWDLSDSESDTAYIKAVYDSICTCAYFDRNKRGLYMIGYGEGGTAAHKMAMRWPGLFAGFVSIGGSNVSDAFMKTIGDSESIPYESAGFASQEPSLIPNRTVPMPVWIIHDGQQNANPAVVDYWKTAAQVQDEGLHNEFAKVYQSNPVSLANPMTTYRICEIWISDMTGAKARYDQDFFNQLWRFLGRTYRVAGNPNGDLRAAYDPEDVGLSAVFKTVDGVQRIYYTFTPSSYDPHVKMPLVIVMHGFTGTAKRILNDTEWHRVADARGFMLVLLQAYVSCEFGNMRLPAWNSPFEDFIAHVGGVFKPVDDVKFIRSVIDDVKGSFAIDESRIYLTGHSNGSMMAIRMAYEASELFAAAGLIQGFDVIMGGLSPQIEPAKCQIPLWGFIGMNEQFYVPEESDISIKQRQKWLQLNGLPTESEGSQYQNGRYKTITYYADDNRTPLVKWSAVKDCAHQNQPEFSWFLWDQFFSKYERNPDTTLRYEGAVVW